MANFITKKDGTRVPFEIKKIEHAIVSAALEAEVPEDEAKNAAQEVAAAVAESLQDQEETTTTQVRDRILTELDAVYPTISEFWRKYEEGKHE